MYLQTRRLLTAIVNQCLKKPVIISLNVLHQLAARQQPSDEVKSRESPLSTRYFTASQEIRTESRYPDRYDQRIIAKG
jgi:hypothetical protein